MRLASSPPVILLRRLASRSGEPWAVLVPLVVVQWAALLAFALTVRHNRWLFYQGGDQTFYYTTSWVLSGWHLPTTAIGYGWSYLLSPLALVVGPNILTAMPAIILLNTLVLLPIALFCVYGIASRIGGRLLGYWTAALWVAAPYLAIPFWDERYHQKWIELFMPQALGLTNLADFPSMVCLLVAALFTFRALESRDVHQGLLAGLAAGFAVGIKPANGLFIAGPVVALLLARRWRQLVPFALALAPAVITLAIWKQRGLGQSPALAAPADSHLAYLGGTALPLLSIVHPVTRYVHVDWHMLGQNLDALREFFWSVRPLEFLPLAGAIAVARRSIPKAGFLFVWFFAYLFIKGSSSQASVEDGSFFRLMMPSYPGYLLLAASIPLLVPTVGRRLAERFPAVSPRRWGGNRTLIAAAVVFAAIPLLIVVAIRPLRTPTAVKFYEQGVFLPIDSGFRVDATLQGGQVALHWQAPGGSAAVFYRIFRLRKYVKNFVTASNPPIREGISCHAQRAARGASDCEVLMETRGVTPLRTFTEPAPPPGIWTYRVGMAANWLDDPTLGDVLMLSAPATVTIPKT